MDPNEGDIWQVRFPLEEDPSQFLLRPVIVLKAHGSQYLCVKVTTTDPRPSDRYDRELRFWHDAGLYEPSTARISKSIILDRSAFRYLIGFVFPDDMDEVIETYIEYIGEQP